MARNKPRGWSSITVMVRCARRNATARWLHCAVPSLQPGSPMGSAVPPKQPEADDYGSTDRPGAPDRLRHAIDHAAHLLPAQGPITVFIHHNTLHAFEDLPFTAAVARAAKVFRCQPYLAEQRYRDALAAGRIAFDDLEAVLREDLGGRADEAVPPD